MAYKLIFVNNRHDAKSEALAQGLRQKISGGEIQDETHIVEFDSVQGIPIQAAPCMFILGTDDLLADFAIDAVLNILDFLKRKAETEQAIDDMAALLKEAAII